MVAAKSWRVSCAVGQFRPLLQMKPAEEASALSVTIFVNVIIVLGAPLCFRACAEPSAQSTSRCTSTLRGYAPVLIDQRLRNC